MNIAWNEPIRGLFQTNSKVGLIFAIIRDITGKCQHTPIPCHNDCRGECVALELMKEKSFVEWAIDPWTGKINMNFEKLA